MRRLRLPSLAATLALALCSGAAHAEVPPAPDGPLACLQRPPDSALVYPDWALREKVGGEIRVQMTFKRSDAPPDADLVYDGSGGQLYREVLRHVASYRLPCLTPGAPPLVVTQEFGFRPDDGRPVLHAVEGGAVDAKAVAVCIDKGSEPLKYPDWPRMADPGTVFAEFRFAAPDREPDVRIVYDGSGGPLGRAVRRHATSYRVTCNPTNRWPIRALQNFRFNLPGRDRAVLNDMTFVNFVKALDRLDEHVARFDFDTMACPFQVAWTLKQPYLANDVGEVGATDAGRREFLGWLGRVDLKLAARDRKLVLGDTMRIDVPCGVVDIRP